MLDAAIWQELGGEKANDAEVVYSRILQIKFLDHVIVGQAIADRPGYFSFQEAGLL